MEDVDRPRVDATEPHEQVDRRGHRRREGVLCAQDDGVGAPLELELGERVGDRGVVRGQEAWAWDSGVDLDGLDADDESVVVRDVDGLYAVVGLGWVSGCVWGVRGN